MTTANKRILVISGPTGVGESTVTKEIMKRYPVFTRLTTATTRAPRQGEQHEIDYYFFSNDEFERLIAAGEIIEYQNNRDTNVYYGTYKPDLDKKLAAGFNLIMNVDIVGARYYKEHYNATTIFLLPDSWDNIEKRLREREPDMDPTEMENRLAYARREAEEEGSYYDHQIINAQGKLEDTIANVVEILKKEGYQLER